MLGGGGSNRPKVQFSEGGKSNLQVQGVDFSSSGLGLSSDATGFQTDTAVNAVPDKLNTASSTLRARQGVLPLLR